MLLASRLELVDFQQFSEELKLQDSHSADCLRYHVLWLYYKGANVNVTSMYQRRLGSHGLLW